MDTKTPNAPVITQPDDTTVVIERIFDAPRDLVWQCWTQAEHLKKWFGPMPAPNAAESDLRPGGAWRIVMHDPKGVDYPGKGVYREVKAPERFTATVDVSEHPDEWFDMLEPGRDKSKGKPDYNNMWDIHFAELPGGKTKVTIRTLFRTKDIRDKFMKLGMGGGWSMSFVKLDRLLADLA